MENLLSETISMLHSHDLDEKDVRWVGNTQVWTTWENFKSIADVDYDSSYGSAEIAGDLLIVGDDWWVSRGEYDGSEWWQFHRKPTLPDRLVELVKLKSDRYSAALGELNPHIEGEE